MITAAMKLMGLLDIAAGIIMILHQYDVAGTRLLVSFILYLVLKGIVFKGDFASMLDLTIAAYMVIMIFFPITIITYLAAIYLFQKGFVSVFL